jgi:hypothetical protein
MLRGFVLARSLHGKPFTFDLRAVRIRLRGPHLGLIEAIARVVWVILGLIEAIIRAVGRLWALLGCLPALSRRHRPRLGWLLELSKRFLGAAASFWLGGVKQNSSEAKPLSCEHLVGVRRFELLTSSVSGKRSPPELNARSRVRECAGNNITELPPSGKNYFLKSGDLRPYPPRCSANSTRKVAFVPPTNSTFA